MAISVTTRSVKGSALTHSEMDSNLNNLAVSSTEIAEGNIEIANQTETNALSDVTKAIVPGYLDTTTKQIIDSYPRTTLTISGTEGEIKDTLTGVEQKWGKKTATGTSTAIVFTTEGLTTHTDGNYNIVLTGANSSGIDRNYQAHTASSTGFTVVSGNNLPFYWRTVGA